MPLCNSFSFFPLGSKQVAFIRDITISMKSGDYDKAVKLSHRLIKLSLKGMNYYQKYDRILLSCIVTLGFLGWISCVIVQIFQETSENSKKNDKWNSFINKIFFGLGCVAVVLLQIEKAPITHYLYCLLALVCWNYVAQQWTTIKILCVTTRNNVPKLIISLLTVTLGLEVLVLSFFYRYILSVGLILLATWPLATRLVKTHAVTVGLWVIHCLTLALFPLLPVVGRDTNYPLVTLAGLLSLIEAAVVLYLCQRNKGFSSRMTKVVLAVQFLILVSAIVILNHSTYNLSLKRGVPRVNHIFSWSTIICCVILPTLVTDGLGLRLLSTTMSLMSVYLLLSTSYEALFFLVLSSTMALWLTLEHQLSSSVQEYPNTALAQIPVHDPRDGHARQGSLFQDPRDIHTRHAKESNARPVSFDDLRCAFFFVYFIITAFFGTGNIASINSFDVTTVYCFLTVFSPFIMGTLLILKILIPFVVVTCVFDAVHVVCNVPVNRLFLLVLIMTDFVALQFFFLVRDYGSWLEIGTSISHFVIMLSFIIYLFFIFGVARYFTRNTWWNSIKTHIQ